jgi:hypothetical protein
MQAGARRRSNHYTDDTVALPRFIGKITLFSAPILIQNYEQMLTKDSPRGHACGLDRVSARPGRCRAEQGEVRSALGSKDLGLRSCNVKWAGVIGFRQARDRSGVVYPLAWHQTLGRLRAPAGHLVSARAMMGWSSPTTPARRRRMVADDVHRSILVGQALWTAIVPTGLSLRAFGYPPAQGFRSRQGWPGS